MERIIALMPLCAAPVYTIDEQIGFMKKIELDFARVGHAAQGSQVVAQAMISGCITRRAAADSTKHGCVRHWEITRAVSPDSREGQGSPGILDQLQPLVLPQPSQTWQEPAGRILVPQVMQSGESTAEPVMASRSSALVWAVAGAGLSEASVVSRRAPSSPSSTSEVVVSRRARSSPSSTVEGLSTSSAAVVPPAFSGSYEP